jgi:hypothetical protein
MGNIDIIAEKNVLSVNNAIIGVCSCAYWNTIRVECYDEQSTVFLNGRERINVKNKADIDQVVFENLGITYLDNINVFSLSDVPIDYVPKPQPVKKDDMYVGMMSCPIWREGNHFGWDKINPFPERKPYLGYYDEGSSEVADWEIKFLTEHGIDYEIFCWYVPRNWKESPIQPRMPAIENALFHAKYKDMLKFSIMWENGAGRTTPQGFKKYIVPFWLEYYFKNPNFLVVDNKPVLYVYSHLGLLEDFGSEENVKEALEQYGRFVMDRLFVFQNADLLAHSQSYIDRKMPTLNQIRNIYEKIKLS